MVRAGQHGRRRALSLATVTVIGVFAAGAVALAQPRDADLERLSAAEASAVADLVAAEAAVDTAEARSAELDRQTAAARERARTAERRSSVAGANARIARRALSERLEVLYRRGGTDPLLILLTADSFARALDELGVLRRAVLRDRALARETATGIRRARAARREAEVEAKRLAAAARAAEAERATLEDVRADRVRTLDLIRADLADRRRALKRVEEAADEVTATVESINAAAAEPVQAGEVAATDTPSAPAQSGRTLRVKAYAYTGGGLTASGLPTGTGRCAVDPAVIPLGTRFEIPGYGPCLAADTGYLIDGATIDVWLPTEADTVRWGIKYLDITIF